MSKQSNSTTKRFILNEQILPESLAIGASINLYPSEEDLLHQLVTVFRAQAGDKVVLMNRNSTQLNNLEFIFEVESAHKKAVTLKLLEKRSISNELPVDLGLALGLPNKPAKLEFILEKAVELGARQIYLIKTEFSQFSHQIRLDRLEKIILEATEQTERAFLPKLHYFQSLEQFLATQPLGLHVALERSDRSVDLLTANLPNATTILIGPEGGFSPSEIQLFQQQQIPTIKLGGSILRMETAALLALGVIRLRLS